MKIAFAGILIALMFVLSWTVLGMIPLGVASATTVFIPVCVGIIFFDDFKYAVVFGLFFGIVSLVRSFVPQGFLDPYFQNPIVSVLPRLLVGIVGYLIYKGLTRLMKNRIIVSSLAGGFIALINTIFTMGILILVYFQDVNQTFADNGFSILTALKTISLLNMLPEIAIGAILTPIIIKVLDKISNKNLN
ncbi:MAG TPA: ECF transporter S component [Bacilli bacterium]|mgnify:FL=1|nr:ECF transporter S component [Acholeplasmataceae bacterium]HNZ77649.1 ECF transporter S component [Bacilli bacterium]HPM15231.1 ECF transporter S component [Bacilli bacterium]HPY54172.1 ECF transporter S component [Bacilli bacterium]HQB95703.1 ECF transporter S component [Bacilli bacterium]